VVVAYATAADSAPGMRGNTTVQASAHQLALCPATRASLQIGRQADGRTGVPLATAPGLLPAGKDAITPASWVRNLLALPCPDNPGQFQFSGRITRGPPGRDSLSIES
jgi:hypothetical protein